MTYIYTYNELTMQVGVFATQALYNINDSNTISGHIQVPIQTANILSGSGHNVTIITTEAPDNYSLPSLAKFPFSVETVPDSQGNWKDNSLNKIDLVKMVYGIGSVLQQRNFDKVHFFGAERVAYLASLLSRVTPNIDIVATLTNYRAENRIPDSVEEYLLSELDMIFCLTNYTARLSPLDDVEVSKPGISRELSPSSNPHIPFGKYVLFWRNADWKNGADICSSAYRRLAQSYPDIEFIYATRPGAGMERDVEKDAHEIPNIRLLVYPYDNEITISDLLSAAYAVVLPFRKLSINPQFAVLESMASKTPVITTDIESNREIIRDGENGLLISPNVEALTTRLKWILDNPGDISSIGTNAQRDVANEWNWKKYREILLEYYEK